MVYGATSGDIPGEALDTMTCYGVGSYSSQVQFTNVSYYAA